jgi:hypothetical protein
LVLRVKSLDLKLKSGRGDNIKYISNVLSNPIKKAQEVLELFLWKFSSN